MEKKQRNKIGSFLIAVAACLLVCCMPVQAATVYTQEQIREAMEQAFDSGDTQVSITTERTFSVNEYERKQEAESYAQELWDILQEVALGKGLLLNGMVYSYRIENSQRVTYQFDISPEFTKEVTVLKSEKSAYKNADAVFIGVGTPEQPDGSANLSYIATVARQIAESVEKDCLVVVKSTVPIGTNDKVEQFINENRLYR